MPYNFQHEVSLLYKYILFDFDGTVFDTVEGITKSARYAINKFGLDDSLEFLRQFAGPPLTDKFMEVYGFTREQAEQAVAYFRERYVPVGLYECSIFPGVKEMLTELKAAGFVLGIATSKPQHLAEKLLAGEGMTELFDAICGSGVSANDDSKASVLRRAMEQLKADRAATVLVGDTKYDVLGAKSCGIDSIGVRYGYAAEDELEQAGASHIVDNVEELTKLIMGK